METPFRVLHKLSVFALVGSWQRVYFFARFHAGASHSDLADNARLLWWGAFFVLLALQEVREHVHIDQLLVPRLDMRDLPCDNQAAQIGFCDSGSGISCMKFRYCLLNGPHFGKHLCHLPFQFEYQKYSR